MKSKKYTPGFEDAERMFDELAQQVRHEKYKKDLQFLKEVSRKGGHNAITHKMQEKEKSMLIHTDPNTDASGFGYADAGQYTLRVVKVEQKEGQNFPYLKWEFQFVDPNVATATGEGKVGHIFENTTLKTGENAQFALRRVCDSLGLEWGALDTDAVVGMELEAQVDIREYQGNLSNEVKKFIKKA